MNHSFRKLLAALAFSAVGTVTWAAGFTPAMQIVGIDVGDTNKMILRLNGNTECGGPWVTVGRDQTYYKDMFAMASVAYSTGKDIRVWVESCNGSEAKAVRMVTGTVW